MVGAKPAAELRRVHGRVPAVPHVDVCPIPVPVVVEPRGTRAAAPVDVELDPTRNEVVVTGRLVGACELRQAVRVGTHLFQRPVTSPPEREDADRQIAVLLDIPVGCPRSGADARVLRSGHAFRVEVASELAYALTRGVGSERWDEAGHESLCRLLEDAGGPSVRVPIDRPTRRVGRVCVDSGHFESPRVGDAVVAHRVGQPDGVTVGDLVHVGRVDVTELLELPLVPSASPDPLAFVQPGHLRRDEGLDV